jgi:hypothetical protein
MAARPVIDEDRERCAAIGIPAICVGKADGKRLLLSGEAAVAFGYDKPVDLALSRAQLQRLVCLHSPHSRAECCDTTTDRLRVWQASGGLEISGLPEHLAECNTVYWLTGEETPCGLPCLETVGGKHLFYQPKDETWRLSSEPFDPAVAKGVAKRKYGSPPVPMGVQSWHVVDSTGDWDADSELTSRELDTAACEMREVELAA